MTTSSKEAAIAALDNFRAGTLAPNNGNNHKQPGKPSVIINTGTTNANIATTSSSEYTINPSIPSESAAIESLKISASSFKTDSKLAKKAFTAPIPVSSGYTVLSTSIKLCTSKSKIILFNISLNNQYLEEIIDDNIFISNVIMDIINKNGTGYSIRKDRRITIKLIMNGETIQIVVNKECNPNVIKEEMFRESDIKVQKQFLLEVQYRLSK